MSYLKHVILLINNTSVKKKKHPLMNPNVIYF